SATATIQRRRQGNSERESCMPAERPHESPAHSFWKECHTKLEKVCRKERFRSDCSCVERQARTTTGRRERTIPTGEALCKVRAKSGTSKRHDTNRWQLLLFCCCSCSFAVAMPKVHPRRAVQRLPRANRQRRPHRCAFTY